MTMKKPLMKAEGLLDERSVKITSFLFPLLR